MREADAGVSILPYLLNEYGLRDFRPREVRTERKITWLEGRGVKSIGNGADEVEVRRH